jgi:hypothetical protein
VEPGRSAQISIQVRGLTMAYTERQEREKGTRYRSVGTFNEVLALAAAEEDRAPRRRSRGRSTGGLDAATRVTRTIEGYAPLFLRHR